MDENLINAPIEEFENVVDAEAVESPAPQIDLPEVSQPDFDLEEARKKAQATALDMQDYIG